MTSIQEQLKALKAQESALKAQLKKSQKKSKEELKKIADFKKYYNAYISNIDFTRIIKYKDDIDIGNDSGDLEPFQSWFAYNESKKKTEKKIHEICDILGGTFGADYDWLRPRLLNQLKDETDDEEEN